MTIKEFLKTLWDKIQPDYDKDYEEIKKLLNEKD